MSIITLLRTFSVLTITKISILFQCLL